MMLGDFIGHRGELHAKFMRVDDADGGSPSKQMPAHFLEAARSEAHDQRATRLPLETLCRIKHPASGVVSRFRFKAQHYVDRLFLEYAEGLRRVSIPVG